MTLPFRAWRPCLPDNEPEKDAYFPIGEPFADVYQGWFCKDNTPLRDAYAAALKVLMEAASIEEIPRRARS